MHMFKFLKTKMDDLKTNLIKEIRYESVIFVTLVF